MEGTAPLISSQFGKAVDRRYRDLQHFLAIVWALGFADLGILLVVHVKPERLKKTPNTLSAMLLSTVLPAVRIEGSVFRGEAVPKNSGRSEPLPELFAPIHIDASSMRRFSLPLLLPILWKTARALQIDSKALRTLHIRFLRQDLRIALTQTSRSQEIFENLSRFKNTPRRIMVSKVRTGKRVGDAHKRAVRFYLNEASGLRNWRDIRSAKSSQKADISIRLLFFSNLLMLRKRKISFDINPGLSGVLLQIPHKHMPSISRSFEPQILMREISRLPNPERSKQILLLGTGPSASKSNRIDSTKYSEVIACNSWVRSPHLLDEIGCRTVAAGDPVFHAGPSEYAMTFRKDLIAWLRRSPKNRFFTHTGQILVYRKLLDDDVQDQIFALNILREFPESVSVESAQLEKGSVAPYPNVLSLLLLPYALLRGFQTIHLLGFDGERNSERKNSYWDYAREANYPVELRETVLQSHPEFRDISKVDYRKHHQQTLERMLALCELRNAQVTSLSRTFISTRIKVDSKAFQQFEKP